MPSKLRYETRPIASLKELPGNARKHDVRNLASIKASLERFGQRQPIVVTPDGIVLAGNGRLKAAVELGWSTMECVICELKDYDAAAFALADNRTAELAGWDNNVLAKLLLEIRKHEAALAEAAGFREAEIALLEQRLKGEKDLGDKEDALREQAKRSNVKRGDVYQVGQHLIACGDSTDPPTVKRLLELAKPPVDRPHLGMIMVTDPPYGVEYEPDWRHKAGLNESKRTSKLANDDRVDWYEAYVLFPGNVAYVWHSGLHGAEVQLGLERAGFNIRAQIIWAKPSIVISRGHYNWQHEPCLFCEKASGEPPASHKQDYHDPCLYAVRQGATANWQGEPSASTVWQINPKGGNDGWTRHSTQKPVECMARPMRNHTLAGAVVYDPFCGSGTTIVAAEKLGRRAACIELGILNVQTIIDRCEELGIGKAKRVVKGRG